MAGIYLSVLSSSSLSFSQEVPGISSPSQFVTYQSWWGRSIRCHHRAGSIGRHGPRETRCFRADILNMEIGRELLFHRGQKPLRTKRYDLFRDPLYAECQQMGKGPRQSWMIAVM